MSGRFVFDQPAGEFTWWHPNGQKLLTGEYIDGKQDGKFVWWHANGMKMMEGEYLAGQQVNTWNRWNEDGKVREYARYSPTGEQLELKQFGLAKSTDPATEGAAKEKAPAAVAKQPAKLVEPGIIRR